jgi:mutator protein MutT
MDDHEVRRAEPLASARKRIGIGIVLRGDQVLVGTRAPEQVLGGMQEFPGGKCHDGESPEACTVRECLEETGLFVKIEELLIRTQHDYPHARVELSFYLCRLSDAEAIPRGDFHWVPLAQLASLNFPEGNREAISKLLWRELQSIREMM